MKNEIAILMALLLALAQAGSVSNLFHIIIQYTMSIDDPLVKLVEINGGNYEPWHPRLTMNLTKSKPDPLFYSFV